MENSSFLRTVKLTTPEHPSSYPYTIAAVRDLEKVTFHPRVTFFVGENGSGKSTIVEALAVAAGLNAEGGSKHFNFATKRTESPLHEAVTLIRNPHREKDGFFLRAESFYNVATTVDELERGTPMLNDYGGISLHKQSHGESFLALVLNRFGSQGLYILDEPEAALSPQRQLVLLRRIWELSQRGSQFIIATHSPILLGLPDCSIWQTSSEGLQKKHFEELESVQLMKDFLLHREHYLKQLFAED